MSVVGNTRIEDINEKISLYESKMRDVSEKYRVGNIDFDTACRMMRSSSSMISIRDFINQLENLFLQPSSTLDLGRKHRVEPHKHLYY